MSSKQCRHCKLDIHEDAHLCPHCHGYQGWIADHRDPKLIVGLIAGLAVLFIPLFIAISKLPDNANRKEKPKVELLDYNTTFTTQADGTRVFITGHISNTSSIDAAQIWFRTDLFNASNKSQETFLAQSQGLLVRAHTAEPFRISTLIATPASEVSRTETKIDRCSKSSTWDY